LRETYQKSQSVLGCPVVRCHRETVDVNGKSESAIMDPDQVAFGANRHKPSLLGSPDEVASDDASDLVDDPADSGAKSLEGATGAPRTSANVEPAAPTGVIP
jgi:hypothetical protein